MDRQAGPRIAVTLAILTAVLGVVGFVVTLVLNAVVYDEFDAYGEVPVPGSGRFVLPAGEATISFRAVVPGGLDEDDSLPVPPLQLSIRPPSGVPEPVVTETMRSVTAINNDVRVRIWVAQVSQEAVYDITARGAVGGYRSPHLAFGRDTSVGWAPWAFGAVFAGGLLWLAVALRWSARAGRRPRPLPGPTQI
ncbi:hypothetical protein CRI77_18935 [Mycolicibacterium duvalii]|uniref:Uncharacterized protein n=1 Tax=Mycolicibacterium duvalii TaxID=39688 RepID=A0A7I7JVQ3_9MYCO|nr:hypothetical protein [Mycolicibacterium duvalii]MCV7369962.1 SHOCT domain-containing protein [Mycolicibacterium duvalii]PEG38334.1 hypothetical protein CRI77_18935 [Mycolicibacterium duvalii]BBX15937.1 hypothetical protein MDUV_07970 [Mycolicibacterium duvalii]